MEQREQVLAQLKELGIPYEMTEHEAVFTIAEMESQGILAQGDVCKNLFVRDAKGRQHYLIVAPEERTVDLKKMAEVLDSTRLSFASAERLEKYLGVTAGSVSPLGILNDQTHEVIVVLDAALRGNSRMGVHPNDNTATLWLTFDGICTFIKAKAMRCGLKHYRCLSMAQKPEGPVSTTGSSGFSGETFILQRSERVCS